jgi:hypothetical protein
MLMFINFLLACLDTSRTLRSTYQSALIAGTTDRYSRDLCASSDYYYQAFEFTVTIDGSYRIQSESTTQMYGYLYRDTFNPSNPLSGLWQENDKNCGKEQLWLNTSLSSNMMYILVVTTFSPGQTGKFKIHAFGAEKVTFKPISESII